MKDSTAVDVITLDLGAPRSMVGTKWLENYLENNGLRLSDLKVTECSQKFRFGHGGLHESVQQVDLPVTVKHSGESDVFKKIYLKVHIVDTDNVPLLCSMNDLSAWQSVVDTGNSTLKVDWGDKVLFDCIRTPGGHMVIPIHQDKFWSTEDTVYVVGEVPDDMDSVENIKRVHEVCNHKSENNLLHAYRNAGILTDKVSKQLAMLPKIVMYAENSRNLKRSLK
jgi:hypothetical protein